MYENIIVLRNIFFRAFLIGLGFYFITVLTWLIGKEWLVSYAASLYEINRHDLLLLMINFIAWMKGILLMLFLVPTLALHWTAGTIKDNENK